MRITVIAVGRLKEKHFAMAAAEYGKRLGRYCRLEIIEVADERAPENASAAQRRQAMEREGDRILAAVPARAYVAALAVEGEMPDSVALARKMERLMTEGTGHIAFLIGGSYGLDGRVLSRADCLLSFSKMTFPHELMRVILLEQVYRGFKIMHNEPYHK